MSLCWSVEGLLDEDLVEEEAEDEREDVDDEGAVDFEDIVRFLPALSGVWLVRW